MFPQMTPMVRNLLTLNIALFVASLILPFIHEYGALRPFTSEGFRPYQIVSYMFLHDGFMHILFNMFALISLGSLIERFLRDKKFIIMYMVCGLFAAVLYNLVEYYQTMPILNAVDLASTDFTLSNFSKAYELLVKENLVTSAGQINFGPLALKETLTDSEIESCINFLFKAKEVILHSNRSMVGASGAVFGVLMAVALYFPNSEMQILFIPFPIKAKYLVLAISSYTVYNVINPSEGDRVAHLAHLAGMIPTVFFYFFWKKNSNSFY